MNFISYLTNNVFKQPPILLGIIAMVGLLIQGKNISDVVRGTFKTIIGVIILFKGVNIIAVALSPLSSAFSKLYLVQEANQFDAGLWVDFIGDYGSQIGIVIILAFIINLLVAKFTTFKSIFLTGHILFWMSYIFVATGVENGFTGAGLIAFSTIFLAIYIIVVPALMRPLVKKVTGVDQFTIGHTTAIFCFIGAAVGKLLGNKEKSTEDIDVPFYLNFFKETTISTSLVIFITYVIVGLIIGQEARFSVYGDALESIAIIGGMQYDLLSFSFMAGLTFGAGLTILLTGVRLMLSEIVPAFKGISDKLIPNAIPALDIPMIFSFAPNALMIGFIVSMGTSILTIIVMAWSGTMTYAVIPLTVACFFDVAPGAIFANAYGGRRGAIISSALNGVIMILLVSFAMPTLFNTVAGFNQAFGGNDFSLWAIISYSIGVLFN